jgi:FdhD protein
MGMEHDILDPGSSVIQENARGEAHSPVRETFVQRITGQSSQRVQDSLSIEEPLEIQLGYGHAKSRKTKSISVTMRTPGDDFDLAAGFLMTEGVVHDANDIETIAYAPYPFSESRNDSSIDAARIANSRANAVRVD